MKFPVIALAASISLLTVCSTPALAGEWVELGSRTVEFKSDRDTIDVGKSEGRFTDLRFKVEDGDLLMEKMKITFGNGDVLELTDQMIFREGSRSHDIQLPGKAAGRLIKKVEFAYGSLHRRDPATIVLYAKER